MRKLIAVELTKIRYYWVMWGAVLFALGASVAAALAGRYEETVAQYPVLEYLLFFYVTGRTFAILTILIAAYAINEDFSMGTVRNVLSVGVDVVKYYLSRLFALMLFISGVYLLSFLLYVAVRILSTGRVNGAMAMGELMGVFLMMALQLMAYVAIAGAISMFLRNQAAAMITGEMWLFVALVLAEYNKSGAGILGFIGYEPLMVMQKVDVWGIPGKVFTLGYFKYGLSAAVLIVLASAVGYLRFMGSDLNSGER